MHRVTRIAGSFAIVLAAYWAYALVAVPLIEPPADPRRDRPISEAERAEVQGRINAEIAQLEGLFPPKSWELQDPKILESDQFKLLMQEYRNLGDGRVEIRPCTMIFMPEGPAADEAQRKRRAVILEAPQGALLKFDQPFDLRRMKIGRLIGGQLLGRITIRSGGRLPGPEDDLLITTRDVQLAEGKVTTPHAVEFRYGPHYGRGAQMQITLRSGDEIPGGNRRQLGGAAIERFELRRVERLHLELGKLRLASGKRLGAPANRPDAAAPGKTPPNAENLPGASSAAGKPPARRASDLPLEVTCQGPFCFDVIRRVATFEDRVSVLRINPTGPSDQLNCELLSIFFSDQSQPAPGGPNLAQDDPKKRSAGSLDLQPQRIDARGNPVVVHAPSENLHARGEHLQYDLQTGQIVLEGTHEVMLQQIPNEIHARSLQYQPGGPGQLGRILAQGPGWLRGQMDQRPQQQLEARWNEKLQVRPQEQNQVISLSGGAGVKFLGLGELDAGEIHFWLLPAQPPRPNDKLSWRPDRMLARGVVRISSPQLSSGTVEQVELWFEPVATAAGGRRPAGNGQQAADVPLSAGTRGSPPGVGERPAIPATGGFLAAQPASGSPARQQHLRISGRLLRARMLLRDNGPSALCELTAEDGVELVETQTKLPDERPLLVRGDRLHVVDADKPYTAVTVTGQPAHFQARGLALTGSNISLNRGTNRLWIDGPGQMDLLVDRDLEGRPLRSPSLLQICWQDGMVFDGRTARFEEAVTVTAPHRYLQTETLEVLLKQAIDFSRAQIQQQSRIERLLCRGGVYMESLSFDGEKQISHERMQVPDLTINQDSGALTAGGPGWLSSVTRRSNDPLGTRNDGRMAGIGGLSPAPPAPGNMTRGGPPHTVGFADASPADGVDQLVGLQIRFQGSITGNVHAPRREMTFHDQVQAAYAPVDSWTATLDVNDPDALGPDGVVMHCDRLSVNEMAAPEGNRPTLELAAEGNTKVEGSTFTACAIRVTYAQAKDLLVLEGDGRTEAQLFLQQQVGAPTSNFAARKIFYWPKTRRFEAEGARSLELDRLPTAKPAKP
jgi:lipopolysaccharide export system protein LptA